MKAKAKPTKKRIASIQILQWPKDGVADFEDLASPLVSAMRFAYELKRVNAHQDIPYKGYDRSSLLHCCVPIADKLSAEGMMFDYEDQGREAVEVIIELAIQLGIEQGRRMERQEAARWEVFGKI